MNVRKTCTNLSVGLSFFPLTSSWNISPISRLIFLPASIFYRFRHQYLCYPSLSFIPIQYFLTILLYISWQNLSITGPELGAGKRNMGRWFQVCPFLVLCQIYSAGTDLTSQYTSFLMVHINLCFYQAVSKVTHWWRIAVKLHYI